MVGHALAMWFHSTFGGDAAKGFKIKKFVKPNDPSEYVRKLELQLEQLAVESQRSQDRLKVVEQLSQAESEKAAAERQRAEVMAEERAVWESVAEEHEKRLPYIAIKWMPPTFRTTKHSILFQHKNSNRKLLVLKSLL